MAGLKRTPMSSKMSMSFFSRKEIKIFDENIDENNLIRVMMKTLIHCLESFKALCSLH